MKVLFNPQVSNQKASKKNVIAKTENPINTTEVEHKLPSFQELGIYANKISFGAKVSVTNQQLMDKIKNLEIEKQALLSQKLSQEVKNAIEKLRKIKEWNPSAVRKEAEEWAEYYAKQAKKAYVGDHGSFWQFFNGDGSKQYSSRYNSEMKTRYYDKCDEIAELKKQESSYKAIVELSTQSEAQKQERLTVIEELIASTKKLIDYQSLQDDINEMLSAKGGLGDRIAGYEEEKDMINTLFVDLLAKSKIDPTTEVPGSIMLYGPTGTGKTTFLQGIVAQSKDYAHAVDISAFKRSAGFNAILQRELDAATNRYNNEKKRTIIILNDAEDIFTISEAEAGILGVELDEQDKTVINSSSNSFKNVSNFKQLLDTVSKIPSKDFEGGRHAATIFITTNYPHLIHPDLLTREGKITKLPIGLASDKNLEEVLKFYFKKMDDVAEKLKASKDNPNYEKAIDSIAGITQKGKENLKKMIKDGSIDKLHVDWKHMPYDKMVPKMNPNSVEGAYSNDGIRMLCQKAFLSYLEQDPSVSDYRVNFFRIFKEQKRDINPQRLAKFEKILSLVQDRKVDITNIDNLLEARDMGLISEHEESIIMYHLELTKHELENLEDKEVKIGLNETEKARKQELIEMKRKLEA